MSKRKVIAHYNFNEKEFSEKFPHLVKKEKNSQKKQHYTLSSVVISKIMPFALLAAMFLLFYI